MIIRNKKLNCTLVSDIPLKDERLSLDAKGLYCLLSSLAKNGDYNTNNLLLFCKESERIINLAIKELEDCCYLKITKNNNQEYYDLFEKPYAREKNQDSSLGRNLHFLGKDLTLPREGSYTSVGRTNNNNTNNNNITIINNSNKDIVEYLNLKLGTHYKSTSNKTQSLIKARLNEGFTIDDFKTVIDKKISDWGNDPKMSKYLRPETLFGTKFESYLNQKQKQMTTKDLVNQGIITLDNFDDEIIF